jgi:hypothetical protein
VPVVHYVPEYHDVPIYIEMPPAQDKVQRNIKELWIRRKDYMISDDDSHEEKKPQPKPIRCANCQGGYGYLKNGVADIASLFN